jgi:hypothetical protein
VTFTNGVTETGTGILLDGRTVLTAAHAVDSYYRTPSGYVQGVIDTITVIPALDDTPPSGGTQNPYGQYLAGSIQLWPSYTPGVDSHANSAADIAVFQLSGSGIASSSIATSQYIGLSAFYGLDAALGWQVAMMGYPGVAPYDSGRSAARTSSISPPSASMRATLPPASPSSTPAPTPSSASTTLISSP